MSVRRSVLRPHVLITGIVLAGLGVGAESVLPAQEPPAQVGPGSARQEADPVVRRRLEEMKRVARRYEIAEDADPPVRLSLVPEPVLRWNNPVRVTADGVVFLWVLRGRPEVVATVYRNEREGVRTERHEFQSLSASPLTATFDGRMIWAPRVAGVAMKPIPGAPAPATTPAGRLRQMRALARGFQVEMDPGTGPAPMRLLTQPLYRYEPDRADVTDGALFAFVLTTDPEALLVIEARPAGGTPAWHYGFGRMSSKGLKARHQGRLVWDAPLFELSPQDPALPYVGIPAPEPPP